MKNLLPNASADSRRLNPHLFGVPNCVLCGKKPHPDSVGHSYLPPDHKDYKNALAGRTGTRRGIRKGMNKTEAEFAERLELQKRLGEIRDYLFHPFRLPWADMHYTPDFMVTPNSGLEKRRMIEVKGAHIHYRQQAIARFKGCRSYWPEFQFECWQKTKQGWKQIL